jgi:hypothetical protein
VIFDLVLVKDSVPVPSTDRKDTAMRTIRPVLVVLTALAAVLALAMPARAAVTEPLGRVESNLFQLGQPNLGFVHNAIQGEQLTSGVVDDEILRGADRITKVFGALRVQVNSVQVQEWDGASWNVVAQTTAAVNSGTATSALSKTPLIKLCSDGEARYRIRAVVSVRWESGRLSTVTRFSSQFITLPNVVTEGEDCVVTA